jgi:NAD(P)-dependent dehydrogenase (short-subunit alcohol dehydrogenase family)
MTSPISKRILVTGGGLGIGYKAVEYLVEQHNATVTVLTLGIGKEFEAFQQTYPDRVFLHIGDVTSEDDTKAALALATRGGGGLDALICSAGIEPDAARIIDMPYNTFLKTINVNLCGTFLSVQLSLPHLREAKGKVVILSSTADSAVYTGRAAYGASKAAVTRFIKSLAWEEQENGGCLSIFGVYPGLTKTPMSEGLLAGKFDNVMLPEEAQRYRDWLANGAAEPPDYCADAVAQLAVGVAEGLKGETASYSKHVPSTKKGFW